MSTRPYLGQRFIHRYPRANANDKQILLKLVAVLGLPLELQRLDRSAGWQRFVVADIMSSVASHKKSLRLLIAYD